MLFKSIAEKVLSSKDLAGIRKKNSDKKIVFCTGCYDILQSGHAVFFNQCRDLGDILVVGVGRDHIVTRLKGPGRPVNPENNRVYLVAAFQDVDFATLNDAELSAGKIDFRVEKAGIVHVPMGKVSFGPDKLKENMAAFIETIVRLKPAASKGTYLRSIAISTTMGPGIKVEPADAKDLASP